MFKLFKAKEIKKAYKDLTKIKALEKKVAKLSDDQLRSRTDFFKKQLEKNKTLEDIKIEAFTVAKEATWRVLKKKLYDVQIIGGLIIHNGSIAEMKTGEGKTITCIPPVYLNALTGNGVLVSTVNEYLTERDAHETGQVYSFLGLTVGVNKRELEFEDKKAAYDCDITYSIHSEIGFDYLRDNMISKMSQKVQRGFNFCLIDEVDSILIDEAKTPLIITGGKNIISKQYEIANSFVNKLNDDDIFIDWETKGIQLSDEGIKKANTFFNTPNIFAIENSELVHRIQNSLRANKIMQKDVEYIVQDGKIVLVDAFTGRTMEGRSYSDGLQQAIQAKEGVEIEPETQTLATITYQNLFRSFKKLSGMTGTAKTEEDEFIDIYNLRVHQIPTNKPIIRIDHPDLVFSNSEAKYKAINKKIKELHEKGQPILVGTEEVSESEKISESLTKLNIPHTVLNAKQNLQEAEIIAKAGELKAVTIATNMAGRGTDIKPSDKSLAVGGLFVLGTSKAESRRIDNQLKGRSGRQGDVGESQFFVSVDDNLFKRFSNQEKIKALFSHYGNKPIAKKRIGRFLLRAQKKIEGANFDARKNVLQYDDVVRQQRDLVYAQRDIIISHENLANIIERMIKSVVKDLVKLPSLYDNSKNLDLKKLVLAINSTWFRLIDDKITIEQLKNKDIEEIIDLVTKKTIKAFYQVREQLELNTSKETALDIEREIVLSVFDQNWQLHIDNMIKLRSKSSFSHYAQKNPFQIYVEQGAIFFKDLLEKISHNTIRLIMQNTYAIKRVTIDENDISKALDKKIQ